MHTKERWRPSDLLRGIAWAIGLDVAAAALLFVLSGPLTWVPALLWAMGALATTGIAIAEERYLQPVGFWFFQLGLFLLFLGGYLKLLILLQGR